MIDMITQIELEDAVKVKARVDKRVQEVALLIARINGEINPDESKDWRLDRYHIDMKDHDPDDNMAHLNKITVTAWLSCWWSQRPPSQKFGLPEWDDHDVCDEYMDSDHFLTRMVQFPRRYLLTPHDTWIDEVKAECVRRKKWWADYNKKGVEQAIERTKKDLVRFTDELEKINKILGEE